MALPRSRHGRRSRSGQPRREPASGVRRWYCRLRHGEATVPELGGVIPSIGDMIVEPGVAKGLNRDKPKNREVYTVTGRYFVPNATGTPLIALVIQVRTAELREVDVLGG